MLFPLHRARCIRTIRHLAPLVMLIAAGAWGSAQPGTATDLPPRLHQVPVDQIREMVAAGVDPDALDHTGQWTALMSAACFGNRERIRALLDVGANLELRDARGFSALLIAADYGQAAAVEALVAAGADHTVRPHESYRYGAGATALHLAVRANSRASLLALLHAGADVNAVTPRLGETPLFWAVKERPEMVPVLLSAGADATARDHNGRTLLHDAPASLIPRLAASGADVSGATRWQEQPLHAAAGARDLNRCRILLDLGADVNAADSRGQTPLMQALHRSRAEAELAAAVVKMLAMRGADLLARDANEQSVLMYALSAGNAEVVDLALAAGADLLHRTAIPDSHAISRAGWTTLMFAVEGGHLDLARLVLDSDVEVNAQGADGWTALGLAAYRNSGEIVELLMTAGADESILMPVTVWPVGYRGQIALTLAAKYGSRHGVEALLRMGADVDAKDINGQTALLYATRAANLEMVRFLLDAGASPHRALAFQQRRLERLRESEPDLEELGGHSGEIHRLLEQAAEGRGPG